MPYKRAGRPAWGLARVWCRSWQAHWEKPQGGGFGAVPGIAKRHTAIVAPASPLFSMPLKMQLDSLQLETRR